MVEQNGNRHTPVRIRHPALDPMASYVSAFGTEALKRVEEDLYHFYRTEDFPRLQERLEFSLTLDDPTRPALRYGLFRLFKPDLIAEYFHKHGYSHDEARQLMDIMGPVTPEFAIANDFSQDKERLKLYCMRLDSVSDRNPEIIAAIKRLSKQTGVPIELPGKVSLQDTALLAMDFHPTSDRRDLKIYTTPQSDRSLITRTMAGLSINSAYLQVFIDIMDDDPNEDIQPPIQCFRFSNKAEGLAGYSLFFIIEEGSWSRMEDAMGKIAPEQHAGIRRLFDQVKSRGWEVSVRHVGFSITLVDKREKFQVYFSTV